MGSTEKGPPESGLGQLRTRAGGVPRSGQRCEGAGHRVPRSPPISTFRDSVVVTYRCEWGVTRSSCVTCPGFFAWVRSLCPSQLGRPWRSQTGLGRQALTPTAWGRAPWARCWRARFLLEPPPVSVCQGGGRRGASFLDSSYEGADPVTGPPSRPRLITHDSPLPKAHLVHHPMQLRAAVCAFEGAQAAHGGPGGGWQGALASGPRAAAALAHAVPPARAGPRAPALGSRGTSGAARLRATE